jgi:signal recognition particle receptor subunit beta
MPTVVQFNKRDLEDIKPLEEVRKAWEGTGIPTIPAAAAKGEGVIETLEALLVRLFRHLDQRHSFGQKFAVTEAQFLEGVMRHFQEPKDA